MSDIPSNLQCEYCKRNRRHGGECISRNEGCLYFLEDSRGCIRETDLTIPFKLYEDIPPIGFWEDRWTLYDNETEIRINKILGITWDKEKGYLLVKASCSYYINEFSDGYKSRTNLKLIRGGKKNE